ncbi:class I SAM-dependent methyltransferase [Candidatus Woesearchaeota archaeon]|nr:class I SAM-dependent methyltransferase [Candidatus Woesearchaeota archaeon]
MDKAEAVLEKIREQASKRFLPIIDAFGEGGKGGLLEKEVGKKKPKRVLEIGTLVGYSAIKIIRNLPPSGKLVTLEIDPQTAAIAWKNLAEAGVEKRVTIVLGPALRSIPKLTGKFDFVFIDAAKEQYLDYLLSLENNGLLSKKAVIFADNAKMFKVEMAGYLDYVRNSKSYKSKYYDFGNDGVEVSQKL